MFDEIIKKVNKDSKFVFFTGAGISTDSGIPDFRSERGLYSQREYNDFRPEEILGIDFFVNHTDIFYNYYVEKILCKNRGPNEGHRAIAGIKKAGLDVTVVTQNIDGLHHMAGSDEVLELHGSVQKNHCMDCNGSYDLEYIKKAGGKVPKCVKCGGIIRPDIVMYGENLDDEVFAGAAGAIKRADFLLAVGSSLTVYPAAGLLNYFHGRQFYIINLGETPYDNIAKEQYDMNSSKALGILLKEIKNGLL